MTENYLSEYDRGFLSFEKISGKKIKDIIGHISTELGDSCFKIYAIVFEDGTKFFVEGEHDFPYITVDERTNTIIEGLSNA